MSGCPRLALAPIVKARRGFARVAEPLLYLHDIAVVRQRIRNGRRAQRTEAQAVQFGFDAGFEAVFLWKCSMPAASATELEPASAVTEEAHRLHPTARKA
jgi:hypothetical protein